MEIQENHLLQWKEWNQQGFIPGPEETEENFYKRINFCLNLEEHLEQTTDPHFPLKTIDQKSTSFLKEVFPFTQELYGIQPNWVPLFFNNYQLSPWHGGCAWIFQLDSESPTAGFLQLRAHFQHSPTFLGIYRRNELIAHELAHIGRMNYEEPKFEEIFAYQSSSSSWRRWLGPIVQSAQESLFFILLLAIVIMTDFALLSFGPEWTFISTGIKCVPLAFLLLGLIRLFYRHQIYHRCLLKLETLYNPQEARHLLYRLLDHEIHKFSRLTPLAIKEIIKKNSSTSFRWHFLYEIYPFRLDPLKTTAS